MSKSNTLKKQPPLHVELSSLARRQLASLKRLTGWTKKAIVENAIAELHANKQPGI
jgi:hypothetical protein